MRDLTVIIVDDHTEFRAILKEFLESQDQVGVVAEAADGKEAVDLALRLHPDLVLMDITMPIMDGFSATRNIKQGDPDIAVAFVSFYDDENYRRSAWDAGGDTFISKSSLAAELPRVLLAMKERQGRESSMVPGEKMSDSRLRNRLRNRGDDASSKTT